MKMSILNSSFLNDGVQAILNGKSGIFKTLTVFLVLAFSLVLLGLERTARLMNPFHYGGHGSTGQP
jgi:hypothetical protein